MSAVLHDVVSARCRVLAVASRAGPWLAVQHACEQLGERCALAATAQEAQQLARRHGAAMAVVVGERLGQPLAPLLAALRAAGVARVVLLGPSFGSVAHVMALEFGFDDVWDGQSPEPLLAALLRHRLAAQVPQPPRTALSFDADRASCRHDGRLLPLGPSFVQTLACLAARSPQAVHRDELASLIPALQPHVRARDSRIVDTHVSRLRAQLRRAGVHDVQIVAVRSRGYRLVVQTPSSCASESGAADSSADAPASAMRPFSITTARSVLASTSR